MTHSTTKPQMYQCRNTKSGQCNSSNGTATDLSENESDGCQRIQRNGFKNVGKIKEDMNS